VNGCYDAQNCYNARRHGSSQTQWLIMSGSSCSAADVEFNGYNTRVHEVGYLFLKVPNGHGP
jgi:hypothetical protein